MKRAKPPMRVGVRGHLKSSFSVRVRVRVSLSLSLSLSLRVRAGFGLLLFEERIGLGLARKRFQGQVDHLRSSDAFQWGIDFRPGLRWGFLG